MIYEELQTISQVSLQHTIQTLSVHEIVMIVCLRMYFHLTQFRPGSLKMITVRCATAVKNMALCVTVCDPVYLHNAIKPVLAVFIFRMLAR